MDWQHPHRSILPSLHGDVVMALTRLRRPVTGRELAADVGASHEGVRQVLLALEEHGLVTAQVAGRARMVALNRDHLALPAIEAMAGMQTAFFERLRAEIARWPARVRPESVVIFGSVARGDATVASDVDVLLVRPGRVPPDDPAWLARNSALAGSIERWTGNRCELIEYTATELREPRRARSSFVKAIADEGVNVYGRPINRIVQGVA